MALPSPVADFPDLSGFRDQLAQTANQMVGRSMAGLSASVQENRAIAHAAAQAEAQTQSQAGSDYSRIGEFGTGAPTGASNVTPASAGIAQYGSGQVPSWIRYSNQSATRSHPLADELVNDLSFLQERGLTFEVFSGGQPEADGHNHGQRVGSTRHDNGYAGDGFFWQGDTRLDWSNPAHVDTFRWIRDRGTQAGITGWGAGQGYMQPGSVHLGYGTPAVWGADGSGINAADWLRG